MGIRKATKSPYYYAEYRDASGIRRCVSLQTKNMRVARMKYDEIIRRRNAIKEKIHIHITWQTFKDKLFYFMSVERSRYTINHMKLAIRYFEEVKKPRFLQDITPELLQKYKQHLIKKGCSNSHINGLVQRMKIAMHLGEKWQLIHKQEWSVVTRLKAPRGRVVFHTPEEIDKILAACPDEKWRIIVLLGADAGLRRGEIMQLKWEDVDFQNNQLYIAPNKTEYFRYVPMTEALSKALQRAKIAAQNKFVITLGPTRNTGTLTTMYRRMAQKANVPSFMHKLRHTFASQLVQNGVELYMVSKLLGHRSIKMTEIYAHLAPAHLQNAVMNLPKHTEPTSQVEPTLHIESKRVCGPNKACLRLTSDFSEFVKKKHLPAIN